MFRFRQLQMVIYFRNTCTELRAFTVFKVIVENVSPDPLRRQKGVLPWIPKVVQNDPNQGHSKIIMQITKSMRRVSMFSGTRLFQIS